MSLTQEDCKKILYNYTKDKATLDKFSISPLSDFPMGFLGDHYKLQIVYHTEKGKSKAEFFLKTLPQRNENHTKYTLELGVFQKEALLYKNLLNVFRKYHTEPIIPKSYLIQPDSFIVLEDLALKGFKVIDGNLDLNHWESTMQSMARLHASTIIFEETRSTEGKRYRINDHYSMELLETTFNKNKDHPRHRWGINTSKAVADSMKLLQNYDPEIANKLVKFATGDIYEYVKPSTEFRNVITHADLWKNNLMFTKNDCVIVDFQLARYAPPAFDLLTTLHVNASTKFLNKHLLHLLDTYYTTFRLALQEHGIKCEEILSVEQFLASIKKYTLPGLLEAIMFATIIFISDELSNKMLSNESVFEEFTYVNRSKYVFEEYELNPKFRERYSDILIRIVEYLRVN